MYLPELKGSKGFFIKFDGFPGTRANEGPVYIIVLQRAYLIFVDFTILKLCLALFLERNNYQGNENVYKEERKDNEENDVKDGHLDTK